MKVNIIYYINKDQCFIIIAISIRQKTASPASAKLDENW